MKQIVLIITCITSIFIFTSCKKKATHMEDGDSRVLKIATEVTGISPENVAEFMDTSDFYLIDLRLPGDFKMGYISEAVNIPRGMLEFMINLDAFWENQDLLAPDLDEVIIIYSKKGKRSVLAAHTLQQMGFTEVNYIEGGYKNWEKKFPNEFERLDEDDSPPVNLEELCGC